MDMILESLLENLVTLLIALLAPGVGYALLRGSQRLGLQISNKREERIISALDSFAESVRDESQREPKLDFDRDSLVDLELDKGLRYLTETVGETLRKQGYDEDDVRKLIRNRILRLFDEDQQEKPAV